MTVETLGYIVTALFIIALLCFLAAVSQIADMIAEHYKITGKSKDDFYSRKSTIMVVAALAAIVILFIAFAVDSKRNNLIAENTWNTINKIVDTGKEKVYIDGYEAPDGFNIMGISLDTYNVRFDGNNIYLEHIQKVDKTN